jgi:hypothetical protein
VRPGEVTLVRKAGATWVHEQRADDDEHSFVHTICGLAFTSTQANLYGQRWTDLTCPACIEVREQRAKDALYAAAAPVREFRPKTGEVARAWAGPRVELLTVVTGGVPVTTVFVDGQEVPVTQVRQHTVDPGAGYLRSEWQDVTRDVTGDGTLSLSFRELVSSERAAALERDGDRLIFGNTP